MQCNLDHSGRQLRLGIGATAFLGGLLLIILAYLQIIELWGWITGGIALLSGIAGVLSACYGHCMLKPVIGRLR
jgi:hypothetical protein